MVTVALPERSWVEQLADVPGVRTVLWEMTGPPPSDDVELAVPPYMGGSEPMTWLGHAPRLRAVQLVTAGYEHALPHLPTGVALANGAGIHDTSTAELAITLTLAALRGIPEAVRAQGRGEWASLAGRRSLADRRVLILGYGSIGRTIAHRLSVFEVAQITAVASRSRAGDDLVDRIHGVDDLTELLPSHDVVLLVLPLTEATRGLVGRDFLRRMPDGALLVNVARGGVVLTDALVAECASGRLMAALDVTDPEPLPKTHPLWRTPGVLISPHVGGASTAFDPRALALLRRELTRFAAGEDLSHLVATG
ncbi:2-hydroxyacid dehydrogenase [Leekyejoonella antrihumi]|uniref:Hydroxyacid dehydrogenase n=1 Tax=Leekyejoonella antrihumi TaxID=1660198 RepID=A0A563DUE3_9MICO|nr:2-hydroxyacid dehydrogenase [Leekyejoonella antrihumi]TWP33304.1 hydroxyacid dehydrogenase [Leekyejoonella antrihumi]